VGIAQLMGLPVIQNLHAPGWPVSLLADYSILLGQLGVGVFFIISGFVIPFSLARNSRKRFLLQRALRIYPVYIVGFLIVVASVALANAFAGTPFPYSLGRVVSHFGILTRGIFGFERIDGISWTLEVELAFYIVAAVIGPPKIAKLGVPALLGLAAVLFVAGLLINRMFGLARGEQMLAALLLIAGLAYHSAYLGRIALGGLILVNIVIAILSAIEWRFTGLPPQWLGGYLVALVIFAGCFGLRKSIKKDRVFLHLADISYPLYVVHALTGYAIMFVLIESGRPVWVALACAFLAAYGLALALRLLIERPFMNLAKSRTSTAPAAPEPDHAVPRSI